VTGPIDSTLSDLKNSKEKLWSLLLSDKQFYAYEFYRDQIVCGIPIDFLCAEIKFGICIEATGIKSTDRLLTPIIKTCLKDAGYEIILLSSEEILKSFDRTVSFLDEQFTSLTRFQCG
jgi:very-short-patch-repair endonuclease